ncbi:hypothetical protein [Streptomyces litchfieldiae]|uniref:Secreted protein n=1 Tax=Streptomyces litchfieldiae TaxID=3075543 RepID=A0ABU2MSE9_9ACTN|nr:hypothetical protein [Streptomyces sp. DSM 44938]MDT0344546.1 hypothetical protein [Streptomyces sp. DSM 44938]
MRETRAWARIAVPGGLALALVAGTAAVAATSGGSPADSTASAGDAMAVRLVDEGWPSAVPASGLAEGLSLPLEEYLISYPDQVAWDTARRSVEQECVTERGLRWFAPVLYADPSFSYNTMNTPRRYGITVLEDAQRYGYELPEPAEVATASAEATDAEIAVLTGRTEAGETVSEIDGIDVPEGGCVGVSAETVGMLDETLANELAGQSMEASRSHPDVVAAIGTWSACMAEAGYEVAHPYDAGTLTTAPAQEIAVTDIGCKEQVGLVETWFAVESAVQEDLIGEHRAALEEEQARNDAVLAVAASLQ